MSVLSTIISTPSPYRAITDMGIISMNISSGLPLLKRSYGYKVKELHAENTILYRPREKKHESLTIGEKIEFLPSYLDGTVNSFNEFHVMKKNKLAALWNISGRGCSQ
jgi:D-serine deaminase-like pyridoxal phosphate-dependent protein